MKKENDIHIDKDTILRLVLKSFKFERSVLELAGVQENEYSCKGSCALKRLVIIVNRVNS